MLLFLMHLPYMMWLNMSVERKTMLYFTNNQIGLEYKYAFYAFITHVNDTNHC